MYEVFDELVPAKVARVERDEGLTGNVYDVRLEYDKERFSLPASFKIIQADLGTEMFHSIASPLGELHFQVFEKPGVKVGDWVKVVIRPLTPSDQGVHASI